MRSRLVGPIVVSTALLFYCAVMLAQTGAQSPAAKPQPPVPQRDLSGVWMVIGGTLRADKVSPMLPEAQAKFDENTAELKKGLPITKDPAFNCQPAGVPHAYQNGAFPFEIVQTPQRIFIFYESAHNWREIWMDGRQIPKDGDATWMGYSVGDGKETTWWSKREISMIGRGLIQPVIRTARRCTLPNGFGAWLTTPCKSSSRSTIRSLMRNPGR